MSEVRIGFLFLYFLRDEERGYDHYYGLLPRPTRIIFIIMLVVTVCAMNVFATFDGGMSCQKGLEWVTS